MNLQPALNAYTQWTSRLRTAYIRAVPPAVLSRLDPPLRRALMIARQVAATPLYLRQRLSDWSGRCGDATARVTLWGKPGSPRQMLDFFFDGDRAGGWDDAVGLPQILRTTAHPNGEADVIVAETTPMLAGLFARRGFAIVPARVRFGADVPTLLATLARPSPSLAADLTRIRQNGFRSELWSYTRTRSELAYRRYLAPYAHARFGPASILTNFPPIDRLFAAGFIITVGRPASPEPDALGIVVPRGRLLWWVALGTRDADPALRRAGALAALYEALIRLAGERGMGAIDVGRCLPWRSDGVLAYKRKWGFRPIADTNQTLEYAIKALRPESAAARRLAERGVLVRVGSRVLTMRPDGRLGDD